MVATPFDTERNGGDFLFSDYHMNTLKNIWQLIGFDKYVDWFNIKEELNAIRSKDQAYAKEKKHWLVYTFIETPGNFQMKKN